jgi:hypothetical protein
LLRHFGEQCPPKWRDFLHFDAAIHDYPELIGLVEDSTIDHLVLRIEAPNFIQKSHLPLSQILRTSALLGIAVCDCHNGSKQSSD